MRHPKTFGGAAAQGDWDPQIGLRKEARTDETAKDRSFRGLGAQGDWNPQIGLRREARTWLKRDKKRSERAQTL